MSGRVLVTAAAEVRRGGLRRLPRPGLNCGVKNEDETGGEKEMGE
jgi:hypothetical protein